MSTRTQAFRRWGAPLCLLACACAGAILLGAAMAAYPGGTWLDPGARGYDFWRNYLCDLTQPVALGGDPNPLGAALARPGFLILVAGMGLFWHLVSRLLDGARGLGAAVRVAGFTSVAGLVLVPFTPSLRFAAAHMAVVILSSLTGLVAATLAVVGLRGAPALRGIGAATLIVAIVDAALYTGQALHGGPTTIALPALQKVAAAGLLAWMAGVAVTTLAIQARRDRSRRPGHASA